MNFRSLFFYLFLALHIAFLADAAAPAATDIAHFTKLAKRLRKEGHNSSSYEEERVEKLNFSILAQIPDYEGLSLKETVANFVSDALQTSVTSSQIIDSKSTEFQGLSRAKVFFLYDKQGDLEFVIKAFPSPQRTRNGFLAEISSMALISDRNLDSVQIAKPLALGKCKRSDEHSYGLLLQTAASGKRADQFIEAIAKYSTKDSRRYDALLLAQKMCVAIGAGFAEFNGVKSEQRRALSRDGYLKLNLKMAYHLTSEVVENLQGVLNVEALKKHVNKKLQTILKIRSNCYYRHGDAGLKNIFYDPSQNIMSFIDVARIHNWIDQSGRALSHDLTDLYHFRGDLYQMSKRRLTRTEINSLLDALYSGYVATDSAKIGYIPSWGDEIVYKVFADLCRSSNYEKIQNRSERSKQQHFFEKNLTFLKNILKGK